MDNSNSPAPQESETTGDSEIKQSSAVGSQPSDTIEEKDSTSISKNVEDEINESSASPQTTSVETAQGLVSEAAPSDLTDKKEEEEAKLNLAPVLENAENCAASESIEGENMQPDNGLEPSPKDETSKATENCEESASNRKTCDTLDSNQGLDTNINNSNDEAAINDEKINTQYNQHVKADTSDSPYYIKWIMWKGLKTPIVTQNDNGPCPLLAIINILLLRRAISFPNMQEMITTQQLMEYLGDVVLKEIPENMVEGVKQNFEQNMNDALSILPKLKTGLDVNVKFTGVGDFEFTPECVIFDLLNIHLYHGWLVDPQSTEYKAAIGNLSYNQLVEKIVASKESDVDSKAAADGLFAESFLGETANQLTHHGICELNDKLNEDELCVFFRNNHFSTLYKHKGELFLLLTDQGFLTEEKIVWQALSSVDGDGIFVDCNFVPMTNESPVSRPAVSGSGALTQEDQDYMLALSIQKEQQQQAQQQQPTTQPQAQPAVTHASQPTTQEPEQSQSSNVMSEQELYDLQYAMQLQEEEESRARGGQQQRQQQQRQQVPERRATRRQTPPPSGAYMQQSTQQRQSGPNCVIF